MPPQPPFANRFPLELDRCKQNHSAHIQGKGVYRDATNQNLSRFSTLPDNLNVRVFELLALLFNNFNFHQVVAAVRCLAEYLKNTLD